jgi:tetratricopeptide (TPR) repeat protein
LETAQRLLEEALKSDPDFASAHYWLGYIGFEHDLPREQWMPHLERALQLSDQVSPRERYMFRGGYFIVQRDFQKALPEFEALVQMYPDDEFGNWALMSIYRVVGRAGDSLTANLHYADLRPKYFFAQLDTAEEVLEVSGDLKKAKVYMERARALLTPDISSKDPGASALVDFFPAFSAWCEGDPRRALTEVDRLAETLAGRSDKERSIYAWVAGQFYLALGRTHDAERVFESGGEYGWTWHERMLIAYMRDDIPAVRRNLAQDNSSGLKIPATIAYLARAGMIRQAQEAISKCESQHAFENFMPTIKGQLALARGQTNQGIALLEQGDEKLEDAGQSGSPASILGVESLAHALENEDENERAVSTLERESARKPRMYGPKLSFVLWLKTEMQLARLYQKLGREKDAERVDDELRKLLAYADSDNPMLLELNRVKTASASPVAISVSH